FISDTGNFELGNKHYLQSYVINKETGSRTNEINNLNNLGRNYMAVSDFSNAADYFFRALEVAEEIRSDEHIALVGTNLISCFFRQKNFPKAAEYANLTIMHAKLANNSRHLINGLMQLGATKLELKDTIGAKQHLEDALRICRENENYSDMAKVLTNLAVAVYPDYVKSVSLLTTADSIIRITGPGTAPDMSNSYTMAEAYYRMSKQAGMVDKAACISKARSGLARARSIADNTVPEMMLTIYALQSAIDEDAGNYKDALADFKRSTSLSDSLFSQDKKNQIAELEGRHKIEARDNEIALAKVKAEGQQRTLWVLAGGLALLAIAGLLIYRQSRARKKANEELIVLNTRLDEANKVKARFFGILSHDLRSPIVNLVHFLELQKENPGLLTEVDRSALTKELSQSAGNLLGTMESMLLWSKEQMEYFKPEIKAVSVQNLFDYLTNFFGSRPGISLSFVADNIEVIKTDENYLRTIMQNLTANALTALTNKNNGLIIWRVKKTNNAVELSISDNGGGIPEEKLEALFAPGLSRNSYSGFGFHIIRDLAAAIEAKISAEKNETGGTTFKILI
ncbi:MAG: tetratricopeptide repeat-containing sensor histidine kinase, partial [Flavitalea sp.]